MARIAVVGAGVAGVASAWLLCRAGHQVTLVDQYAGPAQGASHANGAQLSYAYSDALATPALMGKLPAIVLGRDPAFRVRLQADPEFMLWGLRFLVEALPGRFLANTRHLLQMAARTRLLLQELLSEIDLAFDHAVSGKMILYASTASCESGAATRLLKQQMGIRQLVLNRDEATAIEPALARYPDVIERVVWSEHDAAGRPDAFCAALVKALAQRYGLTTCFGHEVQAIEHDHGQVVGLHLAARSSLRHASRVSLSCDQVVVATGSATQLLPWRDRPFGGVWPVQGYSLTAPATALAMRVSITDLSRKIVFARLGNEVRAAGLADIGARNFSFDEGRFKTFREQAVQAFGPAFVHTAGQDLQAWSGGRPCTPSSRPIVRAGSLRGLYLNLGHGTLGWTLGLGSAERLLEVMTVAQPPPGRR